MLPLIKTANTFRRILNQFDMILFANPGNRINPDRMPKRMHRHTSLHSSPRTTVDTLTVSLYGMLREPPLQCVWRHPQSLSIHIHEHGMCPDITYSITSCYKS